MDCMFVSPKNPYVETLIFNVMPFGNGVFEGWLGLEGEAS